MHVGVDADGAVRLNPAQPAPVVVDGVGPLHQVADRLARDRGLEDVK